MNFPDWSYYLVFFSHKYTNKMNTFLFILFRFCKSQWKLIDIVGQVRQELQTFPRSYPEQFELFSSCSKVFVFCPLICWSFLSVDSQNPSAFLNLSWSFESLQLEIESEWQLWNKIMIGNEKFEWEIQVEKCLRSVSFHLNSS